MRGLTSRAFVMEQAEECGHHRPRGQRHAERHRQGLGRGHAALRHHAARGEASLIISMPSVIEAAGGMKAFRIFERSTDNAFLDVVWMDTGAPHEAGEEVSIIDIHLSSGKCFFRVVTSHTHLCLRASVQWREGAVLERQRRGHRRAG